jgi:hypothetical protein
VTDTRNADLTFAASDYLAFIAPEGTAKPTDFSDLASPWVCLGWLTQDGGDTKINPTTKDILAAGTLYPIRTVTTGKTITTEFTAEEPLNPAVMALYWDVAISALAPESGQTYTAFDAPNIPSNTKYAWVFDSVDGDHRIRQYAPSGMVTGRGDEKLATTDAATLDLTVTFYPPDDDTAAVSRIVDYGSTDVSAFFS